MAERTQPMNPMIAELTQAIEKEADKRLEAQRPITHPDMGALTTWAFLLIIGKAERFHCGKQCKATVLSG